MLRLEGKMKNRYTPMQRFRYKLRDPHRLYGWTTLPTAPRAPNRTSG